MNSEMRELYQQMILSHNKNPKNFRVIEEPSHFAAGHNPLCGDNLDVYLQVDGDNKILDISFQGSGCAISKSAASMMTETLKGKSVEEADELFEQFHKLVTGKLNPEKNSHQLGKLTIFSGIWEYPSRVKCASLSWHTTKAALNNEDVVSTE
ncbi:MAG: SUF system NifU family Fe-S cluster assembly protein [Lentisphaerales bacterium]|nr:SUF system NifU family Fe-S cluster assembly protein [Lentisphaerales bacterium]